MIEENELAEIVTDIKPVCEKFRAHKALGGLSFFEILTAVSFIYFKEKQVDYAVLETGLGGRLDATNVADSLISGITTITLEHTDKLGDTLEKIASEKGGIVKERGVLFTSGQEKCVSEVLKAICRERHADYYEIGKDILFHNTSSNEFMQYFDIESSFFSYKNIGLNLLGSYQSGNAALAISIVKYIDKDNIVTEQAIKDALKAISWPGRMQVVNRTPAIILDGAQDALSTSLLIASIKKTFSYKRLVCVFGVSSDKDIPGITGWLDKGADRIILTKSCNKRAEGPESLKRCFKRIKPVLSNSVNEALINALETIDKEDLILVTGSLFVVGEAIEFFKKKELSCEAYRN